MNKTNLVSDNWPGKTTPLSKDEGAIMKLEDDRIINQLTKWADQRDSVRAAILTSTRVMPNATLDIFSDYDVILVVTEILPYYKDRSWLEAFGSVLVVYRDPMQKHHGGQSFAYITQYEKALKIDFTFWTVDILLNIAADGNLTDDLDVGYLVLLDKDNLTAELSPPTHMAHIPSPPDETTYMTLVEEFFHETTYVAKLLWRDELMPAKYSLDTVMKLQHLRQVLEWLVEIDNEWKIRPGVLGKGLKKHLPPGLWAEFESTYVGADLGKNWDALFKSITLFSKVAVKVGQNLGYDYPKRLEDRMIAYLLDVRNLERGTGSFSSVDRQKIL